MKKALLLFAFCILLIVIFSGSDYADGWRRVTTYSMESINTIDFVTESLGWCAGNSGVVYKTTDGGTNWKEVYKDTTGTLFKRITFLNNNLGFVAGENAKLLKTTDGGTNWTPIKVTGTTNGIEGLHFNDEQTGWILTKSGILKTTDGGNNWMSVLTLTSYTAYNMKFWGNNHGIITGKTAGDTYYTADGTTWTKAAAPNFDFPYSRTDVRTAYAVNDSNIYAGGWGSSVGGQPTLLMKSTDGGASWTCQSQSAENRTYDLIYGLYFKDKDNGLAVGGGVNSGTLVLRTSDGGATWIPIDIPCGSTLNDISGVGNMVWAANSDGFVMYSKDFGDTWIKQGNIPKVNLNAIHAGPGKIVFSGGANGAFFKSTDKGDTWTAKYIRINNVSENIQDMLFLNSQVGFVSHSYRLVAKTTDGGETWKAVIPDTNTALCVTYGLHFVNESLGFAVGKMGIDSKTKEKIDIIYKTTNGGDNWTSVSNVLAANLRDIAFQNEINGIIVGEGLKAAYTTDGGNTWTPSVFNGVPTVLAKANLLKVSFNGPQSAIAVGPNIILQTTDGGANWNYINVTGLGENLTGLVFKDANKGWTVGVRTGTARRNCVYETSDGGNTWTDIADTNVIKNSGTIFDVSIDENDNLWLSGDNGTIYTNSPLTSVNKYNRIALNSFELGQNYPNPFNPSTTIEYSISGMSHVSLNIYDALGKCVKTLVNQQQNTGSYKINLNAVDLASGLYFYSLNVNGNIITKKMSLIK